MKKFIHLFMILAIFIVAIPTTTFATALGDTLTSPETGWQRIDDTDSKIQYYGNDTANWIHQNNHSATYNASLSYTQDVSSTGCGFKFSFYGSKFRIISMMCSSNYRYSQNIQVKIDGKSTDTFSEFKDPSLDAPLLVFEKNNLENSLHTVDISTPDQYAIGLDAIDIENSGYFVSPDTNPTPTPNPTSNSAILEVTMTNDDIKEYDLTSSELNDYLTWYDAKSAGTGKNYYKIPKKSNIKPFSSRNEYLVFDKIYSFEVKEYTP